MGDYRRELEDKKKITVSQDEPDYMVIADGFNWFEKLTHCAKVLMIGFQIDRLIASITQEVGKDPITVSLTREQAKALMNAVDIIIGLSEEIRNHPLFKKALDERLGSQPLAGEDNGQQGKGGTT